MSGRMQNTKENGQLTTSKKHKTEKVQVQAVIDEEPVEHEVFQKLESAACADFRGIFGIKDGISIEIEYETGKWTPAIIDKAETGVTHRFYDEDRDSDDDEAYNQSPGSEVDFVDTPVVNIFRHNERAPVGICFVNRCLIYDTDKREIYHWKMFGDPWDGDEDNDSEDAPPKVLAFNDMDGLRQQVNEFVPEVFVNVLKSNEEFFNQLPPHVQQIMTEEIVKIKDTITEKIIQFFTDRGSLVPGTVIVMDEHSLKKICDETIEEIYRNAI